MSDANVNIRSKAEVLKNYKFKFFKGVLIFDSTKSPRLIITIILIIGRNIFIEKELKVNEWLRKVGTEE
ncbi:hypothetical protein RCL_jg24680.t1 [Rhizophagus clarus]|uniref:Uncharacterized protein n=1 Tax=Rhizophagus clarus TaxID=94130 RepID=A0A8H3QZW0_9GLOM|nr:hypothetical protein RCL_jg24680.t1 [Rhizophagus clarus]